MSISLNHIESNRSSQISSNVIKFQPPQLIHFGTSTSSACARPPSTTDPADAVGSTSHGHRASVLGLAKVSTNSLKAQMIEVALPRSFILLAAAHPHIKVRLQGRDGHILEIDHICRVDVPLRVREEIDPLKHLRRLAHKQCTTSCKHCPESQTGVVDDCNKPWSARKAEA